MTHDKPGEPTTLPEADARSGEDRPAAPVLESKEMLARTRRRNRVVAVLLALFCAVAFAWMLIRLGMH